MFGRSSAKPPTVADLDELRDSIQLEAQRLEDVLVDLHLTRALLADRCRDAGLAPPDPHAVLTRAQGLDPEGQHRFALLVVGLEDQPAGILNHLGDADAIAQVMLDQAASDTLLTRQILALSALRAEEAARRLCAGLRTPIGDETPATSRRALARLDYRRLVDAANLAKDDAEKRVAHLLALAEEEAARRAPRGKW